VIEVLYFEGCPNVEPTVVLARDVAAELGIDAEIRKVLLRDEADAVRLRFLGSPTVRVNGVDIDPEAVARTDYAFGCRLWGESGVPPRELMLSAFRGATEDVA
jgi:hypothetical protein